jgi:hypothetical protein
MMNLLHKFTPSVFLMKNDSQRVKYSSFIIQHSSLKNEFMQTRSNIYFLFFTLLLVVELGFFTFWRKAFDPHTLPFLFLGTQLIIGILPLFLLEKDKNFIENKVKNAKKLNISQTEFWKTKHIVPLSILLILGIGVSYMILADLYKLKLIVSDSDIIPQVQIICKQALGPDFTYKPFDDFGYHMPPCYLPMQWMPYLPSEIFAFDPRFVTRFLFIFTYIFWFVKIIKNNTNIVASVILIALPVLLISTVRDHDRVVWSLTIEQLIMCYYFLLGLSLTTNSKIFQVITIILCLMSRFSLVFWLPFYAFMLWTKEGWKPTRKFSLLILAGCALLYGPFLVQDVHIFSRAQAYYDLASIGEWTRSEKPVHIYNGLGFALYFLEKGGDTVIQIASLKKLMLLLTPSVSIVLGLVWWRFKDKLDFSLFAVCSLKISLAVFYAFIQIPYSYLYVTPIILSLAVLYVLEKFIFRTN